MTKFLQRGHREYQTSYSLEYWLKDEDGNTRKWSGFGFPCTKDGELIDDGHKDAWWKNYTECVNGENNTVFAGIQEHSNSWWEPSIIECEGCSAEVVLDHTMINECECGLEYNMSGQRLAPHDQWGEETGETYSDIAMSDRILY